MKIEAQMEPINSITTMASNLAISTHELTPETMPPIFGRVAKRSERRYNMMVREGN